MDWSLTLLLVLVWLVLYQAGLVELPPRRARIFVFSLAGTLAALLLLAELALWSGFWETAAPLEPVGGQRLQRP